MTQNTVLHIQYHQKPITLTHGCSHSILQTHIFVPCHLQLVYHHLHIVVFIPIQPHARQSLTHFPIDTHIQIAFLAHLIKQLLVMPLPVAHQRSKNVNPLPLIILLDQANDLLLSIFHHLFARQIRVSLTRTRKKQAKEIIHFRSGAHRRARVLVGGFLLDGNHRTQSCNLVHIRTLQISQKISGVCRKRLDIPTLSLGKNGIESQGRLPAPAQSRYDTQAIAGNFHINIFQIVHAGTVHVYLFCLFLHKKSLVNTK